VEGSPMDSRNHSESGNHFPILGPVPAVVEKQADNVKHSTEVDPGKDERA